MKDVWILFAALLLGNGWHLLLSILAKRENLAGSSLSEFAVKKPTLLIAHRIVHILSPLMIIIFGWMNFQNDTMISGLFLLGGLSDIVEALLLNKKTNFKTWFRDPHAFATWVMTLSYFALAIALSIKEKVHPIFIITFVLTLAGMACRVKGINNTKFWLYENYCFNLLSWYVFAVILSM